MSKEIKLIPELRFPEFVNEGDWEDKVLSDVADRITDKVGNKKLTTVSISAGLGFISQAEKFSRDISGKQYKNYIFLKKGEFAFNKGNSKRFPQGCIYKLKEFEEAATPNAFICFRFKSSVIPDFYQGYFDNNYHGRQLLKFITSGARMDGLLNISPADFFNIYLPTPKNLSEQQKIASCLSSLDELIVAHSDKLEALKDYKKGLMQNLFQQKGQKIPNYRFPEFEKDGKWWVDKTLTQVADYENGKAHEKDIDEDGKYIVVNSKFISTEGEIVKFSETAYCPAKKDDILMVLSDVPNGRAIAKCFFVDEDDKYSVNQRICRITAFDSDELFLFYTMDRNPYFLGFDDGVKQTNLRKDDVLNFPFFIPDNADEQRKISLCISEVDELIIAQVEKVKQLQQHKKGLMQGLFPNANK